MPIDPQCPSGKDDELNLHAMLLGYGAMSSEVNYCCERNPQQNTIDFQVSYRSINLRVKLAIKCKDSNIDNQVLGFNSLPKCEKKVITQLAFCFAYAEPVLVLGPTSYKTHAAVYFSKLLGYDNYQVEQIDLTSESCVADMKGGIEMHNIHTFHEQYFNDMIKRLRRFYSAESLIASTDNDQFLESITSHDSQALQLLQDYQRFKEYPSDQGFPQCARGIVTAAKYGGIAIVRGIELADASVVETLNDISDSDPSLSFAGVSVAIHNQFFLVTIAHTPSEHELSAAFLSRYTTIQDRKSVV